MYYYQRLRELRESKNESQKAIAELLNTTQQHYQLYESGKREIPLHLASMLADFYGVSLDYIAGRSDSRK